MRYVQPFLEGGSHPVLVEGDDGGKYVVKLRGAGQGALALVAEVIGGEIGRTLGLAVPEIVLIELDEAFGKNEPYAEIQGLFKRSAGWNVALEFLPESTTFDPTAGDTASVEEASRTVWLDAYILNVDRTAKNANLLFQHGRLWLIDHGAALYFHHLWAKAKEKAGIKFEPIRKHILLRWATEVGAASAFAKQRLTERELRRILDLVPDELLPEDTSAVADKPREAYLTILLERLRDSTSFEEEIEHGVREISREEPGEGLDRA